MSDDEELQKLVSSYISNVRAKFELDAKSTEPSESSGDEDAAEPEDGIKREVESDDAVSDAESTPSEEEEEKHVPTMDGLGKNKAADSSDEAEEKEIKKLDSDGPEAAADLAKAFNELEESDIQKPKTAKERELMSIVFGGKSEFVSQLTEQATERKVKRKRKQSQPSVEAQSSDEEDTKPVERSAVWQDSDDENDDDVNDPQVKRNKYVREQGKLTYERRRKKFEQIVGNPKWADLDRVQEPDSDEEILQTVGHVVKSQRSTGDLPKEMIELKVLRRLNRETKQEGPILSICFHPTSMVAMIAGKAGMVSIVAVDGVRNEKLHTIGLPKFNLVCAQLTPDGNEAIFGSKRRFYHVYNLISGQSDTLPIPYQENWSMRDFRISPSGQYLASIGLCGEVHLLSAKTKELLRSIQLRYTCTALAFTPDSRYLFCHTCDSEVYVYSLDKQCIVNVFYDDGCVNGSSIALCPNGQYVATGNEQGIANIYQLDATLQQKTPVPLKTIGNLTTSIGSLTFNATSELLAIASPVVKNAVRLVHVRSGTVFRNFPTQNSSLGCVTSVQFSPSGGYLAIGDQNSFVSLFRVKHYQNY
ncbi:U3 small nucleolar RNA-associated protein 18 homolog [Anopheles aquasalis]|uniref:U3 small nucleolar RNA-associated protein 18 homolog n=1 Tax=Anopheles aquasalis TaxID=42839 RepID=UPI00215B4074|nr:U3 small nucleolar RNA-associated protein 18 homolog [Anopheles aquasalis]